MSISQMKKRFAELEAYLGKDNEGIKRLKLIKNEANVLRTSLATAEEATQLAVTIKEAARERADVAEAALNESQLENHSLRQQVASLLRDLDTVTRTEEPEEEVRVVRDDEAAIRAVVRSLKKHVGRCPPVKIASINGTTVARPVFELDRETIAPGWSYENLWAIGTTVAVLASMSGKVLITTQCYMAGLHKPDSEGSNLMKHLYDWFNPNNEEAQSQFAQQAADALSQLEQSKREQTEQGSDSLSGDS